tara:strand:+ start:6252 stop:6431 length:180 start_codon:yes stop_codon:yes gene_type:complete
LKKNKKRIPSAATYISPPKKLVRGAGTPFKTFNTNVRTFVETQCASSATIGLVFKKTIQ